MECHPIGPDFHPGYGLLRAGYPATVHEQLVGVACHDIGQGHTGEGEAANHQLQVCPAPDIQKHGGRVIQR